MFHDLWKLKKNFENFGLNCTLETICLDNTEKYDEINLLKVENGKLDKNVEKQIFNNLVCGFNILINNNIVNTDNCKYIFDNDNLCVIQYRKRKRG